MVLEHARLVDQYLIPSLSAGSRLPQQTLRYGASRYVLGERLSVGPNLLGIGRRICLDLGSVEVESILSTRDMAAARHLYLVLASALQ